MASTNSLGLAALETGPIRVLKIDSVQNII